MAKPTLRNEFKIAATEEKQLIRGGVTAAEAAVKAERLTIRGAQSEIAFSTSAAPGAGKGSFGPTRQAQEAKAVGVNTAKNEMPLNQRGLTGSTAPARTEAEAAAQNSTARSTQKVQHEAKAAIDQVQAVRQPPPAAMPGSFQANANSLTATQNMLRSLPANLSIAARAQVGAAQRMLTDRLAVLRTRRTTALARVKRLRAERQTKLLNEERRRLREINREIIARDAELAGAIGSRGSTVNPSIGRYHPRNLRERLAVAEVRANPNAGRPSKFDLNDSRWPASEGWVKKYRTIEPDTGSLPSTKESSKPVHVHYNHKPLTGETDDFKIIDEPTKS